MISVKGNEKPIEITQILKQIKISGSASLMVPTLEDDHTGREISTSHIKKPRNCL